MKRSFKQFVKNDSGFYAIEAVVVMPVVLFVLFLILGFVTLIYPVLGVRGEVSTIAKTMKVEGGLTASAKANLMGTLDGLNLEDVTIQVTPPNADFATTGNPNNYVKKYSGQIMTLTVRFNEPSSANSYFEFFGVERPGGSQIEIKQSVVSEKW